MFPSLRNSLATPELTTPTILMEIGSSHGGKNSSKIKPRRTMFGRSEYVINLHISVKPMIQEHQAKVLLRHLASPI